MAQKDPEPDPALYVGAVVSGAMACWYAEMAILPSWLDRLLVFDLHLVAVALSGIEHAYISFY